jgi:type 1 fimbriae regulatory protein FimB/type 1 fimbriae regulatory protein FimE
VNEVAPLSIDGAQKLIERVGDRAGIKHLHIHMLRHSTGYALAGRGVDTRTLQAFMGHKNSPTQPSTRLWPTNDYERSGKSDN